MASSSESAKYSEITIDRVKVQTTDLIQDLFSYKFNLNIDYDLSKLKHFSDAKSILQKEYPVFQKNLAYFQHLQQKIETFNQKVLYLRNFNYSKIFSKFLRTLSQKIAGFYDVFYAKTLEQEPIKDVIPKKEPLKELNFPMLRNHLKDRVIKVSNELYAVLSDKPRIVFEEELSNICEKIIRLNEFLHSNEANIIANMKLNCGSFLMSLCSQRFEESDNYLCVDHEKISYFLNDVKLNLPKHYPVYLSKKKFMLESLHKIVTDDLNFTEKNNKIDIKAVGRAVFQRDRMNLEKQLGDAVRKAIENKELKDDAEDFKRNIESLTNEMQRVRLEGEIIKENPVFVKILEGSIDVETIGFLEESEQNEELLMNIEKLACDYYRYMKNVKDLFERMMFFTKEEELFYKNKYFQVLNSIIQIYYAEVAKNNLETFISGLFTKLDALLFKEKNAIVENELEGKLLTELEKNQDNPYLGQLFSALQEAEKKREVYSKHIKEKKQDFRPEEKLDLEQTKLTRETSNFVYKEAKHPNPPSLAKSRSLQIKENILKEGMDFSEMSPMNIKKPSIFITKPNNEKVIKLKASEPNYDFEKDLKSKKTSIVRVPEDEGVRSKEQILSAKSKDRNVSLEDDFAVKTSSGRSKGLNVKFDDKKYEKEEFYEIENPPALKRLEDDKKDSRKGSSKNLLGDLHRKEEEEDFYSKNNKGLKKDHDEDDYFNKKDYDDKKSSNRNLLGNMQKKDKDEDEYDNSNFKDHNKNKMDDKKLSSRNLLGDMHNKKNEDEDDYFKNKDQLNNKKASSNRNLLGDMHQNKNDEDEDDYFKNKNQHDSKKELSNRNLLGDMHNKKNDEDEDDYFKNKNQLESKKALSNRNLLGDMHQNKKDDDEDDYFKNKNQHDSKKELSNRNLLGDMHHEDEDDYLKKSNKQVSKKNLLDKYSDRKLPGFDEEEEFEVGFGGKGSLKKNEDMLEPKKGFNLRSKNDSLEDIQEDFPKKKDNFSGGFGSLDKKIDNFPNYEDEEQDISRKKKLSPKDSKKSLFSLEKDEKKQIDSHRFSAVKEEINMERPLIGLTSGFSEEIIEEKPIRIPDKNTSNFALDRLPADNKKKSLMVIENEAKKDDYDTMFMKLPTSKEQLKKEENFSRPGFEFTQQESLEEIQPMKKIEKPGFSPKKGGGFHLNSDEESPEIIPEYKIDERKTGPRPLEKQKAGLLNLKPMEEKKPEKPGLLKHMGKMDDDSFELKPKFDTFDDGLDVLDDLLPSSGNKKPIIPPLSKGKTESPGKKGQSPAKKGLSPLKMQANVKDFEGDEGFQEEIVEEYQDDFHDDAVHDAGSDLGKHDTNMENQGNDLKFETKPLINKEDLGFIDSYMVQSGMITENLPIDLLNNFDVIETLLNEAFSQERAFFFSLPEGEKLAGFLDRFHDIVGKSGKLTALKQCEKELNAVSEHLANFHLGIKEKMEFDLNCRIFIPFDKPSIAFYLIEIFIVAKKVFFYYKKTPDKKAQDKTKNMLIILQEIFKFPEDTPSFDIILKEPAIKELEKLKTLNYLPFITTAFQIIYETPEGTHAEKPLIDFNNHTVERMFVIASITGQVFQMLQGEGLAMLTQHFEEIQTELSSGTNILVIHHEETLEEEVDTNKIAGACYEIIGGCLKKLETMDQIFLALVVIIGNARYAYYFHFTNEESETQEKPIMRLFYLVDYDSLITGIVLQITNSVINEEVNFECFFDFARHNGLYDFSQISVVIWAEYCLKQGIRSVEAFRFMSYSMIPFYEATRGLMGEEGEEEGEEEDMENMAMMGNMGKDMEGEGYDEQFEVDEDLLPE